ncbi:MAG: RluA family pseudouridine synthase [Lentisphaeraceae bacterium]|nr:RluA family pseudouridine synthase [Lentisphaeraceae bacterium]
MEDAQIESWTVLEDDAGERLDKYLVSLFDEFSRVLIQKSIRSGAVTLKRNGKQMDTLRIGEKIFGGDAITFDVPQDVAFVLKAEDIDIPIIYEDEHMLVVNKPAGMVVHPGAGVHDGTLVNALLGYSEETFRPMDEEGRPGIVHRLDKETSGLLLVAKTRKTKEKLSKAFAKRNVEKYYIALVRGHIRMGRGTLESYIGRSKENRQKMASYEDDEERGKLAITHYKVMAQNQGASLVKVKIETGRTHQIRVHMSSMGFPVIGDKLYGTKRLEMKESPERHLLHAWKIRIDHPITGEPLEFTSPLPENFTSVMDKFKIEAK